MPWNGGQYWKERKINMPDPERPWIIHPTEEPVATFHIALPVFISIWPAVPSARVPQLQPDPGSNLQPRSAMPSPFSAAAPFWLARIFWSDKWPHNLQSTKKALKWSNKGTFSISLNPKSLSLNKVWINDNDYHSHYRARAEGGPLWLDKKNLYYHCCCHSF